MSTLNSIIKKEKEIALLLEDLIAKIAKDTAKQSMDGVRVVAENAVIVNTRNLKSDILAPSYYIQSAQANAVKEKLEKSKTATEFVNKIKEMIETKKVKIGNDTVSLNPKTLEILQSYIGDNM